MRRRLLVVGASVAMLATGPGGAFAGEVKGPPGTLNNTNETGALNHANSACAASGLNDFDLSDPDGQTASQVQTAPEDALPHEEEVVVLAARRGVQKEPRAHLVHRPGWILKFDGHEVRVVKPDGTELTEARAGP